MKKYLELFLVISFPIYSFISWLIVYNTYSVGQNSRVKIFEENFLFGLTSSFVTPISIMLLLYAIYMFFEKIPFRQNFVLNMFLLLTILFLLISHIWGLL
jgi:hypothetical protein